MGVYVEGHLDVAFHRELSDAEYEAWHSRIEAGRGPGPCDNREHAGATLGEDGRCVNYREVIRSLDGKKVLRQGSYCYTDSGRFDPDNWMLDDEGGWGDIGTADLRHDGFTIDTGGKVYDVTDATAFFVECLPADVIAHGFGKFSYDGHEVGVLVDGREVIETESYDVESVIFAGLAWLAAFPPSFHTLDRETFGRLIEVLDRFARLYPEAVTWEQKRAEKEAEA